MSLIDKIKNNAGKIVLVGAVGLSSLLYTGCQTAEHQATGRRMLGWALGVGSNNPDLTQQQAAAAGYAGQAMTDANRDEAIRNGGGTVIINNGNNQPLYTIEIYNLDENGRKEIEMVSSDFFDYFSCRKDVAKNYRIVEKTNGRITDDFNIEVRIEKDIGGTETEYNYFYRDGKFRGGTAREPINKK